MDIHANHVSVSNLYHPCHRLVPQKKTIEAFSVEQETSLFGLKEKLVLCHLTHTSCEGNP